MKRLITLFVVIFLLVIEVEAAESQLYFNEKNGKLYYDVDKFEYNSFMAHDGMSPGKVYTDELEIKNESENKYDLYLRVNLISQSILAEELINSLEMEIYVDDELFYKGPAHGTAYDENGVAFQRLIPIGTYESGETKKLVVKTNMSKDYSNTENQEIGTLGWEFFAGYEYGIQPIVPEPNGETQSRVIILVAVALVLTLVIYLVYRQKTGLNKKMRMKKVNE